MDVVSYHQVGVLGVTVRGSSLDETIAFNDILTPLLNMANKHNYKQMVYNPHLKKG